MPDVNPSDNIKLVLDKLEEYQQKITALEEQVKEVTDFNRELLSRKEVNTQTEEDIEVQKAFDDYLHGK